MGPNAIHIRAARRTRAGFTLVELLVVLGIIAVLVAMLMPAIQKSRYEARVTACAARLQQFAAKLAPDGPSERQHQPEGLPGQCLH